MAYTIERVAVWVGPVADRPGGAAEKLAALSEKGANLEFVIGRRDKPRSGLLFVAPLKGVAQTRAAAKLGLSKAKNLHSLRVEGPDKPGLCAKITAALAASKISMRGISAAAVGRRCVIYFAFDSGKDTNKARRVLKRVLDVR